MKDTGQSLGFMILDSKSFKSLDLLFEDKSVEYYLIPFNPASQKIILKIGLESYDIPFKSKSEKTILVISDIHLGAGEIVNGKRTF